MKFIRRIFIWCRNLFFLWMAFSLAMVIVYKYVPVYYTPLMFIRLYEDGGSIEHHWTPVKQIAQPMIQAVVASEDNRFMQHHGFDSEQIRSALKEARKGRRLRGASTISQQTAKNVFLWPARSYFRKALEMYFTLLIEWIWGKERIMEVYLNSIETGAGIYGVEAAARTYFGKQAYELTREECAMTAAVLPDPRHRNPAQLTDYLRGRQRQILSLMRKTETVNMGYRQSETY
jgi:monofunctional biosynthetic peptidoglycan transglycosylase